MRCLARDRAVPTQTRHGCKYTRGGATQTPGGLSRDTVRSLWRDRAVSRVRRRRPGAQQYGAGERRPGAGDTPPRAALASGRGRLSVDGRARAPGRRTARPARACRARRRTDPVIPAQVGPRDRPVCARPPGRQPARPRGERVQRPPSFLVRDTPAASTGVSRGVSRPDPGVSQPCRRTDTHDVAARNTQGWNGSAHGEQGT